MSLHNLISEIELLGVGDQGFGGVLIGGYCLQQEAKELAALIQALEGRKIDHYLQVGSAAGGTERFICEKTGCKNLYIIDIGDHEQFSVWTNQNRPALEKQGVKVMQHIGDSHDEEAAEFLSHKPKMDLIGIDGDHTPAGVRMDWQLIEPCLKPGTLVWMHDINAEKMRPMDNGPWEVWQKLKARHNVLVEVMGKFGIGLVEIV